MAEAVAEEYRSSLGDLNFNSKPHINMLTMLAEENVKYAAVIVETILTHINSVPPDLKLPSLYLVDSIMKNIGGQYITLFSKHMITLFSSVFEKVEETTRSSLYKLRQTWNEILPKNTLYGLDCNVNHIDPAWPITAKIPSAPVTVAPAKNAIHVNPKWAKLTLGGSPTQANPTSPKKQGKPVAPKKNEPVLKEKEVMEIKKKQEEMLRLIEEKKVQLKALEQKKLEMAAKQKKKPPVAGASVMPPPAQIVPKKPVNQRDPRLKKNLASLQSVVVVPNPPAPSGAVASSNGNSAVKPDAKIEEKSDTSLNNKAFNAQGKTISPNATKGVLKEKHNANREHFNKSWKASKKHPLSPDKLTKNNNKKFCKQVGGKMKRPISQDNASHFSSHGVPAIKKGKHEPTKSTENLSSAPAQRLSGGSALFGNEDKDYRHQLRPEERLPPKWHHPETAQLQNARLSHEAFEQRVPHSSDMPTSLKGKVGAQDSNALKPPVQMPCERNFPNVPMESSLVPKDNTERSCMPKATSVPRERQPPPLTTSFVLDGKKRTVHFVNNRALTFTDNNEPKELSFIGPPRNVYIEGLPHPILLSFGGRPWEFEVDGKRNIVQLGSPSREIYVNNYPYEAQFAGPPITVLLENKKEHRLKIDGPPPQVVISEKPAFELLEIFNLSRGLPQTKAEPSLDNKIPEGGVLRQDIDMRLKPNPTPANVRDIDWRHGNSTESSQAQWNPAKNSFETFTTAAPDSRSYTTSINSTSLDYNQGSVGMNSNINTAPWPHPGYRDVSQTSQRPPFDHINQNQQPPNSWEMKPVPVLPPPPGLPPSLILNPPPMPPANLSQMSSFSLPPPSQPAWKPLPPPPMFGGSVPDQVKQGSLPTSTSATSIIPEPVASLPALPVNVETIYEKLVAAGFFIKQPEATPSNVVPEETKSKEIPAVEPQDDGEPIEIPEIRLTPKSLRNFKSAVIIALYRGSQCATCGMRFKEIQSEQYSRHLDWHFRMNRREKDGAKKAYSRRLYYEVKDWTQFKEIEEAAERTPSYFELQADGDNSRNEEKETVISVPASKCESEKCSVCGEQFQLFWVEEEEEWHLKHAMRHEGEAYHPSCYEDFQKAEELAKKREEERIENEKREAEEKLKAEAEAKIKAEEEAKIKVEEAKVKAEEEAKIKVEEEAKLKEETEAKIKEEAEAKIKEEEERVKLEIKEENEKIGIKQEKPDSPTDMEVDPVEGEEIKAIKEEKAEKTPEMEVDKEKAGDSKKKKAKKTSDEGTANSESEEEEELRPPTPDPRFQVLPKVLKGTELSALCSIM